LSRCFLCASFSLPLLPLLLLRLQPSATDSQQLQDHGTINAEFKEIQKIEKRNAVFVEE